MMTLKCWCLLLVATFVTSVLFQATKKEAIDNNFGGYEVIQFMFDW